MAQDAARDSKAWPFVEARKLVERLGGRADPGRAVVFETGYGPSGLPHIGTFAEVLRTTMVRRAFAALSDAPTRLIAFSDDMDGLRSAPDNIPNPESLAPYLAEEPHGGTPLTAIPDPFGTHDSFGHHNNARLMAFLDDFGFEYEFKSATECYRAGVFDPTLLAILERHDEIVDLVRPTIGPERRQTYCPFLPLSPTTGKYLHAPAEEISLANGAIVFRDAAGKRFETPVTGGHCKLAWRVDWGMRWVALGVDYEMSGKDLIDSVKLSSQVCRRLGGTPPAGFTYELFLDENGEKISKSRGNGLTIEEWLRYGSKESLAQFMFQSPRKAKRLYFDIIPRTVDDYLAKLEAYGGEPPEARMANPVWHIHGGAPPAESVPLSFAVLLNLASVCNADDKAVLWSFIARYAPGASPAKNPILDELAGYALATFRDFVKPAKAYRAPTDPERAAIADLAATLVALPPGASAADIQYQVYEVGKRHGFTNLRQWFGALYEVLLGQTQGPRMGSFIALYGVPETVALIEAALAGEALGAGSR
jgi:lysyl-tRNA synthetase class 1